MTDDYISDDDLMPLLEGWIRGVETRLADLEAQNQKPMDLIIAEAIFGRERLKELGIS